MEYEKDFYQYLTGDEKTIGYQIEYMSGPNIVSFGKKFGDFPYNYSWGGQNLSRWDYMKKIIDFVEEKINLDSFFHVYFSTRIAKTNPDKENQKNFLKDLNRRLLQYGQKINVIDNKIKLQEVKQETILDDIDLNFEETKVEESNNAIGEGGFANIYSTDNANILRKALRNPNLQSDKIKKRFEGEFRMLKLIANEKFIIPVLDYDNSEFSYTMKKADGSFYELVNKLDDQEKIMFFYQLGEAIEYIHSKSLFHRDIKAQNCLKIGNRWVLADFGISKDDESLDLTTTGNAFGTPGYIHPEIIEDKIKWKNYLPKYDYYQYGKTVIDFSSTISDEKIRNKISNIGERLLKTDSPENLSILIKEIKIIFTEV